MAQDETCNDVECKCLDNVLVIVIRVSSALHFFRHNASRLSCVYWKAKLLFKTTYCSIQLLVLQKLTSAYSTPHVCSASIYSQICLLQHTYQAAVSRFCSPQVVCITVMPPATRYLIASCHLLLDTDTGIVVSPCTGKIPPKSSRPSKSTSQQEAVA